MGLLVALEELELAPTFLAGAGARARGAGGRLVGGLDGAAGTDAIACAFFFDLDLDFFPMLDGMLREVVFVVEGVWCGGVSSSFRHVPNFWYGFVTSFYYLICLHN